ncbi:unnamed protein product [Prunus armeniaca]
MIRLDLSHNDAFIINIQIAQVVIDRIHVDECSTPISCNFRLSSKWAVGPSQISRLGAPGRGDVRQHVTSSFWMRCGCAGACQHGLPCVEMMMRFG